MVTVSWVVPPTETGQGPGHPAGPVDSLSVPGAVVAGVSRHATVPVVGPCRGSSPVRATVGECAPEVVA
jgi:hypothetical protein